MNKKSGFKLVVFIIIIALAMASCSRNWERTSIWALPYIEQVEGAIGVDDGVFTGTGDGYFGEVYVEVTVKGDAIVDIRVISHSDTDAFARSVFTALIPEIMARQSTGVDLIAGATYTARGLVEGVEDALVSAGADLANLRARADAPAPVVTAAAPAPALPDLDWPERFTPGTFEGFGEGYYGEIVVAVTFDATRITAIEVIEHSDTPMFANRVWSAMIPAMLAAGHANVDIVAGATYTSEGLIDAVFDAAFEAEDF